MNLTGDMSKKISKFLEHFQGSAVVIVTARGAEGQDESGNPITEMLNFNGILLDADETFIYLGPNYNTITLAVRINDVVAISCIDEDSITDESLPRPRKEEMN